MKYDILNYCYKKTFLAYKEIIVKSYQLGNSVCIDNGIPCFLSFDKKLSKEYKCCQVYNINCDNINIGTIYIFKEMIYVKYYANQYLFYYDKMILPMVLKKYNRYLVKYD